MMNKIGGMFETIDPQKIHRLCHGLELIGYVIGYLILIGYLTLIGYLILL